MTASSHLYLKKDGEDIYRENGGSTGFRCSDERGDTQLIWTTDTEERLSWSYAQHGAGQVSFYIKRGDSEFELMDSGAQWNVKQHSFTVPEATCSDCVVKAVYQLDENENEHYDSCVDVEIRPAENNLPEVSQSVQNIFNEHCVKCHKVEGQAPNLSSATASYSELVSIETQQNNCGDHSVRVKPGVPSQSLLYMAVTGQSNCVPSMPIGGKLSNAEQKAISDWIVSLDPSKREPATISFEHAQYSIGEGGDQLIIEIVTSGSDHEAFSVQLKTVDVSAKQGADFVAIDQVIDFSAGETKKTILLTIVNDSVSEPTETFNLTLSNPSEHAILAGNVDRLTAAVSILDNDQGDSSDEDNTTENSDTSDSSDQTNEDQTNEDQTSDKQTDDNQKSNDDNAGDVGSGSLGFGLLMASAIGLRRKLFASFLISILGITAGCGGASGSGAVGQSNNAANTDQATDKETGNETNNDTDDQTSDTDQSRGDDVTQPVELDEQAKNGLVLWQNNCQGCHGNIESTDKRGRSVALIQGALSTVAPMSAIKLTDIEVSNISKALEIKETAKGSCVQDAEIRSIDCFYSAIINSGISTVADAVALLPGDMKDELFLMEETQSRHMADTEHPRIIMYGDEADFIVSMSSHPKDPLYEVFEMIEPLADGGYKFRLIDMTTNPPTLSQDDKSCQSCHFERARPIWNRYRDWPGLKETTEQERMNYFTELPARFGLLNPKARWSGEVWNFQHARLFIRNLMKMAKSSKHYSTEMRYKIAALGCEDRGRFKIEKLLPELGIDAGDIQAGVRWFERTENDERNYGYGTGANSPESALLEVAIVDLLYQDKDRELQNILKPFIDFMQKDYPIDQDYYDRHNGLLPFAVPQGSNGGSEYGYGGRYYGLHLFGLYSDFWGLYPREDFDNPKMLKGGELNQAFCQHVKSKVQMLVD